MAIKETLKIKFPVLKNVEYFDVSKDKNQVKVFTGNEINGLKWRDVSLLIGKIAGQGVYRYTFKFNNDNQIYNGSIRGVVQNLETTEIKADPILKNQIEQLTQKVNALQNTGGGFGMDLIVNLTKQSYETQISFLNLQLSQKDINISKLESQIDKLNIELDQCYDTIDDLKKNTGVMQYLDIAKKFLDSKLSGVPSKNISLKDSNPSDIPEEILNVLGVVNWSLVDDNLKNKIVDYLNKFIPLLPLKG